MINVDRRGSKNGKAGVSRVRAALQDAVVRSAEYKSPLSITTGSNKGPTSVSGPPSTKEIYSGRGRSGESPTAFTLVKNNTSSKSTTLTTGALSSADAKISPSPSNKGNPYAENVASKYATTEYWDERFRWMIRSPKKQDSSPKKLFGVLAKTSSPKKSDQNPNGANNAVEGSTVASASLSVTSGVGAGNVGGTTTPGTNKNGKAPPGASASNVSSPDNKVVVPIPREEFYNVRYSHVASDVRRFLETQEKILGLSPYARDTRRILHVGCGFSHFGTGLWHDGYRLTVNCDISPVAVRVMREAFPEQRFALLDVMDMVTTTGPPGGGTATSVNRDIFMNAVPLHQRATTVGAQAGQAKISHEPVEEVAGKTSDPATAPSNKDDTIAGAATRIETAPTRETATRMNKAVTEVAGPETPEQGQKIEKAKAKSVHAIVDKGVLDSLLCGSGGQSRFKTCMDEVHKALIDTEGYFIALTGSTLTMTQLEALAETRAGNQFSNILGEAPARGDFPSLDVAQQGGATSVASRDQKANMSHTSVAFRNRAKAIAHRNRSSAGRALLTSVSKETPSIPIASSTSSLSKETSSTSTSTTTEQPPAGSARNVVSAMRSTFGGRFVATRAPKWKLMEKIPIPMPKQPPGKYFMYWFKKLPVPPEQQK
ncbi:unnamed protein product [Amoebophrya sp. A25]|nr:unnamed protein product [Amoebophrya sp. A25]|eukprot:GSA25T00020031001.1